MGLVGLVGWPGSVGFWRVWRVWLWGVWLWRVLRLPRSLVWRCFSLPPFRWCCVSLVLSGVPRPSSPSSGWFPFVFLWAVLLSLPPPLPWCCLPPPPRCGAASSSRRRRMKTNDWQQEYSNRARQGIQRLSLRMHAKNRKQPTWTSCKPSWISAVSIFPTRYTMRHCMLSERKSKMPSQSKLRSPICRDGWRRSAKRKQLWTRRLLRCGSNLKMRR